MSEKLFISYADEDKNKMEALYNALKKSNLPILPIVVAKRKMPVKSLSEKVKEGILESRGFIPIITRNSISNQWVNQEVGYSTAHNKFVLPIIDKNILHQLKGFLHSQMDLPFNFESNKQSPRKESHSFRKCYQNLLEYIKNIIYEMYFSSEIEPKKVKRGKSYTTKVYFKGVVKNAFFDNFVKHLESDWETWNWDKSTLKDSKHTTPGELHGRVEIKSEYTWKTKNWPKGNYKIYTGLYDHITPGKKGRIPIIEIPHDFVVE